MDHALRTISYIADIGDLVVLMARRRFVPHENDSDQPKLNRTPKMICHVFESEEVGSKNFNTIYKYEEIVCLYSQSLRIWSDFIFLFQFKFSL